jgi:hypothetical protein
MAVSIKDLLPPPAVITVGNGTLSLRGLSLEDVSAVLTKHKDDFALFFVSDNPDFSGIISTAPKMVTDIIALAADAVGQEDYVRLIPASTQLVAIAAIWELSVPDPLALRRAIEKLQGEALKLRKPPPETVSQASKSLS